MPILSPKLAGSVLLKAVQLDLVLNQFLEGELVILVEIWKIALCSLNLLV